MGNRIAVVLGLTLVAGAVFARSFTPPEFYELDANSDGVVTRAELSRSGVYELNFTQIDKNRDGTISKSEYAAATTYSHKYK